MFYSTQILARKGPLAIVWIAAHMDRQLKRNQVRREHGTRALLHIADAHLAWAVGPLGAALLSGTAPPCTPARTRWHAGRTQRTASSLTDAS